MIGQHDGTTAPIFVHFAITEQIQNLVSVTTGFGRFGFRSLQRPTKNRLKNPLK
jgi:hypothetical protein